MTIVANTYTYVIGVDTHSRTHTVAVVSAANGALQTAATFPTTAAGLKRAVSWIAKRTGGLADVLVVIEGIGSYGAGLARCCAHASYRFVEPFPTARRLRRGRGKSDELDAELIACSVLSADTTQLREPREDSGIRAALRVLVTARDLVNVGRTREINALTALLRTVDLGIDARRPLSKAQIVQIAAWRSRSEDIATATARKEAIRLARRVRDSEDELAINREEMTSLVQASDGAHLLDEPGIGPVNAAVIIAA